jgi:hypothetical protein
MYQGCQIFLGPNMPNWEKYNKWPKLCQTAINYTKWPYNIPNGHKNIQQLPFKGPPKFTQIGIFGLKTNHLATLIFM